MRKIRLDSAIIAAIIAGVFGVVTILTAKIIDFSEPLNEPIIDRILNNDEELCFIWDMKKLGKGDGAVSFCIGNNTLKFQTVFSNMGVDSPPTLCNVTGSYKIEGKFIRLLRSKGGKCDNGRNFGMEGDFICTEEAKDSLRCIINSGHSKIFRMLPNEPS